MAIVHLINQHEWKIDLNGEKPSLFLYTVASIPPTKD